MGNIMKNKAAFKGKKLKWELLLDQSYLPIQVLSSLPVAMHRFKSSSSKKEKYLKTRIKWSDDMIY